ncbi:MAG: molybdenum cofactor guanylyltransferase [Bacillota bacterium]
MQGENRITGIILAGGQGTRLGGIDKAFLEVGGIPLVEHVLGTLSEICGDIIVVSRTPEDYRHYEVRSVEDLVHGAGPLGGLYTGLMTSRSSINFVTACDMPFLNGHLIRYMISRFGATDILIPRVNSYVEPLHALYSRACISAIESRLQAGERKLSSYFDEVSVAFVEEEEISRFDPDLRMFTNINHSQDIETAERMRGNETSHDCDGCY